MDKKLLKHGMFSWFELQTPDVASAKKFYKGLFGWKTTEMKMPGMKYTTLSVGKDEVAGMMALPPQGKKKMPPQWGVYITVDDVDATVKKAAKLGGKVVVAPTDIPGVGRFSVLLDPQGAMVSVITYGN
jgi:predicted enzyme related to lactoylglutathione lyase